MKDATFGKRNAHSLAPLSNLSHILYIGAMTSIGDPIAPVITVVKRNPGGAPKLEIMTPTTARKPPEPTFLDLGEEQDGGRYKCRACDVVLETKQRFVTHLVSKVSFR